MYIDSAVYQVFFEILKKTFIEKELKGKLPVETKRESVRSIWDHKEKNAEGKLVYRALELFSGRRTDSRFYFQRKHEELNSPNTSGGPIDNLALVKALEYIGIQPPSEEKARWNKKWAQEKAKALYDKFLVEYEDSLPPIEEITFGPNESNFSRQQRFKTPVIAHSIPANSALTEAGLSTLR